MSHGPNRVVCLGEVLVDFIATEIGVSIGDAPGFTKASGGAVANVAVGLGRLDVPVSFISKVGNDEFGFFLKKSMEHSGVDSRHILVSDDYQTALVFAALDKEFKPYFAFFGNPSADMMLHPDEISSDQFYNAKWFHCGTVSMSRDPARAATIKATDLAREQGLLVSFDPNLRLHLYKDHDELRELTLMMIGKTDLLKLNDNEMEFLVGTDDPERGAAKLMEFGPRALVVTLGEQGAYYDVGGQFGIVPGFKVKTTDTTGAGDGFMAGLIHRLMDVDFPPEPEVMADAVRFANAVGAISTTEIGAVSALPPREEVEYFLRQEDEK